MEHPDVVVVGAGVIGAACAEALTAAGVEVLVLDRAGPASGTTAAGEGNLLISDKAPGPELVLAQASLARWPRLLDELRSELGHVAEVEWQPKGGLVVATAHGDELLEFAARQRAVGVRAEVVMDPYEYEPDLTRDLDAAVFYPEDAQLQPVLAATTLLAAVRRRGGEVRAGVTALGLRPGGVVTSAGFIACGAVVNACGPWAGEFSAAVGAPINVQPRRGVILVTARPMGIQVRHKVYDADYVGAVGSSAAELQTSTVVESTMAGSVLVGSSRERVGFDDTIRVEVLRVLARKAVRLFPGLADVPVMRAYGGFRPYAPDHLPVIGPDPRVPGLWHVTGHEGAGIVLAAGTGQLLADLYLERAPAVDPEPFRVDRAGVMA
ncbi:NAD(P)/FAD-dependent oxidoreductase [Actinocrispum wychmicini]|uniref:Glycine/D-amino acid oxidase-like deaminating enzyme n=1 Tax=Actinocrispum wychmicini TaxID=1213861 RepID=A0A4R2JQV2_9PSEU|nr:FAD-dependent oxidoreductase [Actinocrispum wychmicini]TCO62621.1 glycine/D-amino acid oxidase-like deaminating enzyme [Actinocrispum wychmicini]